MQPVGSIENLAKLGDAEIDRALKTNQTQYKELLTQYLASQGTFSTSPAIARSLARLTADKDMESVNREVFTTAQNIQAVWRSQQAFAQAAKERNEAQLPIYLSLHDQKRVALDEWNDPSQHLIEELTELKLFDVIKLLHDHKIYSPAERKEAARQFLIACTPAASLPRLDSQGPLLSWDDILAQWTPEKAPVKQIAQEVLSKSCSSEHRVKVFESLYNLDLPSFQECYEKALTENHILSAQVLRSIKHPEKYPEDEFKRELLVALKSHGSEVAEDLIAAYKPTDTVLNAMIEEIVSKSSSLSNSDVYPLTFLTSRLTTPPAPLLVDKVINKLVELSQFTVNEKQQEANQKTKEQVLTLASTFISKGVKPTLDQWNQLMAKGLNPKSITGYELTDDLRLAFLKRCLREQFPISATIEKQFTEDLPRLTPTAAKLLIVENLPNCIRKSLDSYTRLLLSCSPLEPNTSLREIIRSIPEKDLTFVSQSKLEAFIQAAEAQRQPTRGPAENELAMAIDLKSLGHFMGDAYLLGLVEKVSITNYQGQIEIKETPIEGDTPSRSAHLVRCLVDTFIEKHRGELDSEQVQRLRQASNKLQTFEIAAAMPMSLQDYQEWAMKLVRKLQPGESLILPTGYCAKSGLTEGHSMVMELRRTDSQLVEIDLYNTQYFTGKAAAPIEQATDPLKKQINTLRRYKISLEDLETAQLIRAMTEPLTANAAAHQKTTAYKQYGTRTIYSIIEPFALSKEEQEIPVDAGIFWQGPQYSGTCSMATILAWLRPALGKDLNKFFKVDSLMTLSELALANPTLSLKDSKPFRMMMERAMREVPRKMAKGDSVHRFSEKQNKAIQELSSSFQQALVKQIPDVKTTYLSPDTVSQAEPVRLEIPSIYSEKTMVEAPAAPRSKPVAPPLLETTWKSLMEVKSYSDQLSAYHQATEKSDSSESLWALSRGLIDIGKFLSSETAANIYSNRMDSEIDSLTEKITQLSEAIIRLAQRESPSLTTYLALNWGLIGAWNALTHHSLLGPALSKYGVDPKKLVSYLHQSAGLASVLSPTEQKEFDELQHAFSARSGISLFEPRKMTLSLTRKDGGILIQPSESELSFSDRFWADHPIDTDQAYARIAKAIDEGIENYLKNAHIKKEATLSPETHRDTLRKDFDTLYRFQQLPDAFMNLRSLAILAQCQSPVKKPSWANPNELKPQPPLSIISPTGEWAPQIVLGLNKEGPTLPALLNKQDPLIEMFSPKPISLVGTQATYAKSLLLPESVHSLLTLKRDVDFENDVAASYQLNEKTGENSLIGAVPQSRRSEAFVRIIATAREAGLHGDIHPLAMYLSVINDSAKIAALTNREEQLLLQRTLFLGASLGGELRTHPQLSQQALEFFNAAIRHYQGLFEASMNLQSAAQTLSFLLQEKMRLLCFIKAFSDHPQVDSEIRSTLDLMEEVEANPLVQNAENRQRWLYTQLQAYEGRADLSHEDIRNICLLTVKLQRALLLASPPTLFLSETERSHALKVLRQLADKMRQALPKEPAALIDFGIALAKSYGIAVDTLEWVSTEFPMIHFRNQDGSLISCHLLKGQVEVDEKELSHLPKSVLSHRTVQRQIQDIAHVRLVKIDSNQGYYEGVDRFGEFRISVTLGLLYRSDDLCVKAVQRKINDRWCTYSIWTPGGYQHTLRPDVALANTGELIELIPSDQLFSPEFLLIRMERDKPIPVYRLKYTPEGNLQCVFEEEGGKVYTLMEIPQDSFIRQLDPKASLWSTDPKNPNAESRLIFANSATEHFQPLEFVSQAIELQGKKTQRWVLNGDKQLMIAQEQRLKGFTGNSEVLLLENRRGQTFAAVPEDLLDQVKYRTEGTIYALIEVDKGWLAPKSPETAAFATLLTFSCAAGPDDYKRCLQYLKSAYSFGPFSVTTLQRLTALLRPIHGLVDNSVEAAAVKLYAAWLLDDNFKRNPNIAKTLNADEIRKLDVRRTHVREKIKKATDALHQKDDLIKELEHIEKKLEVLKKQKADLVPEARKLIDEALRTLSPHYFQHYNKLDLDLRLTTHIGRAELEAWGIRHRLNPEKAVGWDSPYPTRETTMTFKEFEEELKKSPVGAEPPKFRTAPGKAFNFPHSLTIARGPAHKRKELRFMLWQMMDEPYTLPLRHILLAVIAVQDGHARYEDRALASLVDMLPSTLTPATEYDFRFASTQLYELATRAEPAVPFTRSTPTVPKRQRDITAVIGEKPLPLPKEIPQRLSITVDTLPKANAHNDPLKRDREALLTIDKTQITSSFLPFAIPRCDDPILAGQYRDSSIEELNSDYEIGRAKNQSSPHYKLNVDQPQLASFYAKKSTLLKDQTQKLEILEKEIVQLANKLPQDTRRARIEENKRLAGQTKPLTIDDCIFLYHQDHKPLTQRHTQGFLNDQEIDTLHQLVGKYMVAALEKEDTRQLVVDLEGVSDPATYAKLDQFKLAQKLGQTLTTEQHFDFSDPKIPKILLVFQYYLGLRLRKHQVEGLQKILATDPMGRLKLEKWMLQRIQGGGKTLVFGHILAMAKADGYHLSVHVSPTPQYPTSLYDMRAMSGRIYRQTERTFVFDDSAEKYSLEYLGLLKGMFIEAITSREYLTVTKETLQTMRCKYTRERFLLNDRYTALKLTDAQISEIQKGNHTIPGIDKSIIEGLVREEQKLELLEDLLSLLRDRGVFTFDEVQIGFNPKVILNMPYGPKQRPKPEEVSEIGRSLILANQSVDKGRRLLEIEKNRQSQQTNEDYHLMIERTIDQAFQDPSMNQMLGLDRFSATDLPQLRAYLKQKNAAIPQVIKDKNPESQKQWVLLRMLLGGGWLQDRLNQSINEHCGLSSDPSNPEIAIPFAANMDAIEGSEFSNVYVTLINTMLTFFSNGLSNEQITKMIFLQQNQAFAEKAKAEKSNRHLLFSETESAVRFKKSTGVALFPCDAKDSRVLERIAARLRDGSENSMTFLMHYMEAFSIPEIGFYTRLIASNGQNVSSMSKSFVGYSGSFDNVHISPVGSLLDLDAGTNGQTVDKLISENDDVWVSPNSIRESLDQLFTQHPHRAQVRAFIDVGSHFLGYNNHDAAVLIAGQLKKHNPGIKGILFFDDHGNLCNMNVQNVKDIKVLTGTRPEVIAAETGLTPAERFTLYGQKQITGIDILQADDTYAIVTFSEHTQSHEVNQGVRRLRALDIGQRVIEVVQKSALHKFASRLGKDFSKINYGHPSKEAINVSDLILYSHLVEKTNHLDENDIVAIQKMGDLAAQCVLDEAYDSRLWSEKVTLFRKTQSLFSEDIAIDLVNQFGSLLVDQTKLSFLNAIRKGLLSTLREAGMDSNQIAQVDKTMQTEVIDKMLATMRPTIQVAQNDLEAALKQMNMDSTVTQQQEQRQQQQQEQQTEVAQVTSQVAVTTEIDAPPESQLVQYTSLSAEEFSKLDFLIPKTLAEASTELQSKPQLLTHEVFYLTDVLAQELPTKEADALREIFGKDVLVSRNLIQIYKSRTDLLSPLAKPKLAALVISSPTRIVLCSPVDAALWKQYLEMGKVQDKLRGQGRDAWIVTCQLKETTTGMKPLGTIEDHVSYPALLLMGQFAAFSDKSSLLQWLDNDEKRQAIKSFIEKQLLPQLSPEKTHEYRNSVLAV